MSISPPQQPSLLWRSASTAVMAATGLASRVFLYAFNSVEVVGLDGFLARLDARRDVDARERGLLTVCNHVSVLDDPLIWGVLPWRYLRDHRQLRWGLGAHDICYKNDFFGTFFNVGQTLPTHRLRHSPLGGLFQPTLAQAIGILSKPAVLQSMAGPEPVSPAAVSSASSASSASSTPEDALSFSTNGVDRWPAPAAYAANRAGWVHIFPEGGVQQHRERAMRYFRWGVARLILESEPAPDVVPMFIEGPDRVMPEDRTFPRFLPRIGQRIRVVFGDALDPAVFADARARWRKLVRDGAADVALHAPAAALRIEVALQIRNEVLKLRRQLGYPEEDPANGLAETWAQDPHEKRFRSHVDGRLVNQD